jgi:hypothetical protein
MCDEIGMSAFLIDLSSADYFTAGTLRHAELKPGIAASLFPSQGPAEDNIKPRNPAKEMPGSSKTGHTVLGAERAFRGSSDEFGDDVLDDGDLLAVGQYYPKRAPEAQPN